MDQEFWNTSYDLAGLCCLDMSQTHAPSHAQALPAFNYGMVVQRPGKAFAGQRGSLRHMARVRMFTKAHGAFFLSECLRRVSIGKQGLWHLRSLRSLGRRTSTMTPTDCVFRSLSITGLSAQPGDPDPPLVSLPTSTSRRLHSKAQDCSQTKFLC